METTQQKPVWHAELLKKANFTGAMKHRKRVVATESRKKTKSFQEERQQFIDIEYSRLLLNLFNEHAFAITPEIQKDIDHALHTLNSASELDSQTWYDLGMVYFQGKLVERQPFVAVECFLEAATKDEGLPIADYQVGRMFYLGDGIGVNEEIGLEYLTYAVQSGHQPALEFFKLIGKEPIDFDEE